MSKIDEGGHVNASWGMWKDASGSFDGMYVNTPGITRRDWLAGLAMQGMLANDTLMEQHAAAAQNQGGSDIAECNRIIMRNISVAALAQADSLIAEGRKGE